jgi:excisionase family DNA binding protein
MAFSLTRPVTVPEAADELGLSRHHLYKLIRAGTIPHYRYSSRSIRLDIEEIRAAFHLQPRQKTPSAPVTGELAEGA